MGCGATQGVPRGDGGWLWGSWLGLGGPRWGVEPCEGCPVVGGSFYGAPGWVWGCWWGVGLCEGFPVGLGALCREHGRVWGHVGLLVGVGPHEWSPVGMGALCGGPGRVWGCVRVPPGDGALSGCCMRFPGAVGVGGGPVGSGWAEWGLGAAICVLEQDRGPVRAAPAAERGHRPAPGRRAARQGPGCAGMFLSPLPARNGAELAPCAPMRAELLGGSSLCRGCPPRTPQLVQHQGVPTIPASST